MFTSTASKAFLLATDHEINDAEKHYCTTSAYIQNWLKLFDNCMFLLSDVDAYRLSELLAKSPFGNSVFFLTELEHDAMKVNGRIPPIVWEFLKNRPTKPTLLRAIEQP